MDIDQIRTEFPMLKKKMHGNPLIYFDSAATSLKPQSVIDAISNFYTNEYGTVHRAVYQLAQKSTERYAEARVTVKEFICAVSDDEIIFTRGTTSALNLVAQGYGRQYLNAGDEILISEMEHHANIVPWQMLCKEKLCHLKVIPVTEQGELDLQAFDELLSNKTKIVSVTHVSNMLGTVNPIKLITEKAHQVGAIVVVDGAQSVPHMPVDVHDLGCDFFAFSGHKMCGPIGIGVLYGRKEILEQLDPVEGGGDMIEHVTFEKTTFQPPPLRFEAGTPLIAQVIGLQAAIHYLETIGMQNIAEYESKLFIRLREGLKNLSSVRFIGDAEKKGAMQTFEVRGVHSLDLGTMLDLQGVALRTGHHCAQPIMRKFGLEAAARASLAFYNTCEEVDKFVKILDEVITDLNS